MDGQLAVLTGLGGVLIAVISFVIGNNRNESKARSRIYERLDETKDEINNTFTRQDVCNVVHKQVDNQLERIEKATECIPKIKVGIDMLLKKNGLNGG